MHPFLVSIVVSVHHCTEKYTRAYNLRPDSRTYMMERLSIYTICGNNACRMYIIRVGKKLWNDQAQSSARRKYNCYSVATGIIIHGFDALEAMIFIFGLILFKS